MNDMLKAGSPGIRQHGLRSSRKKPRGKARLWVQAATKPFIMLYKRHGKLPEKKMGKTLLSVGFQEKRGSGKTDTRPLGPKQDVLEIMGLKFAA